MNIWYVQQVAGFLRRVTWPWALVFSAALLARTAYDWRVPTHDFALRSQVSTYVGVATLASAGCFAS